MPKPGRSSRFERTPTCDRQTDRQTDHLAISVRVLFTIHKRRETIVLYAVLTDMQNEVFHGSKCGWLVAGGKVRQCEQYVLLSYRS